MYKNRFEQIKDIIKTHIAELVLISVYIFLFSLPLLFWLMFASYTSFFEEAHILNVVVVFSINALLLTISGLGFAGGFYVCKRLLFNEGTSLKNDFFIGVKKNGKSFALLFFILGLFYLFLQISIFSISLMEIDNNYKMMLVGVSYVVFFLLLLTLFFTMTQSILYSDSLIHLLINGLKFTCANLYKNIPIFILCFAPYLVFEFVSINEVRWVIILLGGFFYLGCAILVFMTYSNHIFDKAINIKQFPSIYKKGLKNDEDNSDNLG